MNKTISNWSYVIKNCSVENTYKMSWSKSIVECCIEKHDTNEFTFSEISHNMFKYYWNQMMFVQPNFQQSSNPNNPPRFLNYVRDKIEEYKLKYGNKPTEFERVESNIKIDYEHLNSILKKNVCFRFLKVGSQTFDLYQLDLSNDRIILNDVEVIRDYSDILFDLINFRWTQILELFNSSHPRISKKIKVTDRGGVERSSLSKFHKYLKLSDSVCFICNQELNDDISIDHLIPWSFIYSDDIWNLVYTHKGCNSSKSNRIVKESEIKRLEERNYRLLQIFEKMGITDKQYEELKFGIENRTLRKFWNGFK